MKEAIEILRTDPKLQGVMETVALRLPPTNEDVYLVLLKSIVEQQLSLKAAATIWQRLLERMVDYPSPDRILNTPVEDLRGVGLSYQKANYLQHIAHFAIENDLSFTHLSGMDDHETLRYLTQIKGVGKWTAEMIMMFSLGRTDVFPVDDLVIRNAMIDLYEVKSEKRQLIHDLEAIASRWRPYRSYACYLLWDWKDQT
jgi:DNA-3-methyladenine glycosylase II